MLSLVSHLTFKERHGDSRLTGEEGRRGVFFFPKSSLGSRTDMPLIISTLCSGSDTALCEALQQPVALHAELPEASQWFEFKRR